MCGVILILIVSVGLKSHLAVHKAKEHALHAGQRSPSIFPESASLSVFVWTNRADRLHQSLSFEHQNTRILLEMGLSQWTRTLPSSIISALSWFRVCVHIYIYTLVLYLGPLMGLLYFFNFFLMIYWSLKKLKKIKHVMKNMILFFWISFLSFWVD